MTRPPMSDGSDVTSLLHRARLGDGGGTSSARSLAAERVRSALADRDTNLDSNPPSASSVGRWALLALCMLRIWAIDPSALTLVGESRFGERLRSGWMCCGLCIPSRLGLTFSLSACIPTTAVESVCIAASERVLQVHVDLSPRSHRCPQPTSPILSPERVHRHTVQSVEADAIPPTPTRYSTWTRD